MFKSFDGIWMINEIGFEEIRVFLTQHHINQKMVWEKNQLYGWVEMAERQMDRGNPPVIELKAWESLSGRVEEFQISDVGITKWSD